MKNNSLLQSFQTPYETVPFQSIKPEHFQPAIEKNIELAQKEIEQITRNAEKPTFENTLEALAFSGAQLDRITSVLFNLNSAETNKDLQNVADTVMPLLTKFENDIKLNKKLFERIKYVYDNREAFDLNEEQNTLLDKTYKSFTRNGANLQENRQKELRKIDKELAQLKLEFNKNVLAETNAFSLHITHETDLKGLPESHKQAAAELAQSKNKTGWLFTLHYPSYVPFMKYIDNRELRKKMALAYATRAYKDNPHNNRENVLKIVQLRYQRAKLLGYNTHADFVLEERMAQNPDTVWKFLDDIHKIAYPAAQKEMEQLQKLARKDGIEQLQMWDVSYYMQKLKKQKLDLDDEALKPYFQLEKVEKGVFEIARKLYGLHFEPIQDIDTYHPDVKTYKVTDENDNFIAIFYADYFPRPGKRQGAWMTSYKSQWKKDGQNSRPHISIVCNFTKPTTNHPSLLSFNEVTTLFHEFGHALHGMLADTTYPNLSGTHVYWDFVELPSQIMENWAYEPEALKLFAYHYKTQELLPDEMIEKIKKSLQFMEGYATNRQLSFGYLDMNWHHHTQPETITDVEAFEQKAFEKTRLLPVVNNTNMSVGFSHIFPGGYAAGYYSYKWAEVLDADAFEYFKEKGIFHPEPAQKFKKLLQSGGTVHPLKLYRQFRGHKPKVTALLKRAGLVD